MFLRVYYNDDIIINTISVRMKSFLNYFALKLILRNILKNVTVSLFKYFVSHIIVILRNELFLYYRTNEITLCCIILRNAFLAPE